MKFLLGSLIGLVLSVHVSADPLLKGRVRLPSGQPAVGAQVRLFDLTDLRWSVGATTDAVGYFALSLGTALPTEFALEQNYPNPFNPSTLIPYQLPTTGHVRLDVFNVLGQRLATLVDAEQSAGTYTAQWDGTDAAGRAVGAGVYIYRLRSGGMTASRRMVLVDGQAGIPAVGSAAQGPVQSEVEGAVEADDRVYGLTVSGAGLIAYADPAFRVGINEVDLVVKKHGSSPRLKLTTDRILGDVNNDGQVDASDALYVLLYSDDPSIELPNNGDISLGDVNGDGQVDRADAVILSTYSFNPDDPTLPPGIGQAALDSDPDAESSYIYYRTWTSGAENRFNKFWRSALDGSNLEELGSIPSYPEIGLGKRDLDVNGGKIYWVGDTKAAGNRQVLRRANLDGTNIEDLTVLSGISYKLDLEIAGDKIYWIRSRGRIQRANLDGTNIEDFVGTSNSRRMCLAVDTAGDKVYWGEDWQNRISRANLDGTNIEHFAIDIPLGFNTVNYFNVAGDKIYWRYRGDILGANLDGNIEKLVSYGVGPWTVDVAGDKIYWIQTIWIDGDPVRKLRRANLDGTNTEDLFTTDFTTELESIRSIALGPYYELTNPPEEEEIRTRSRGEARSELAERSIPYSTSSFVTYARNGDLDMVRLFVEAGMDINSADESLSTGRVLGTWGPQVIGDTALMWAAEQGHIDVVRFLVEQGADLRIVNELRQNALTFAAAGGDLEVVIFLIDHGAYPPYRPIEISFDRPSFYELLRTDPVLETGWAAARGHSDVLHVLLNAFDWDVSGEGLSWATFFGHLDIVRFMVKRGAPLNPTHVSLGEKRGRGNTPLMFAAAGGHLDVVRLLLENGADIHVRRSSTWIPIETPFGTDYHEDISSENAFTIAIDFGHTEVVRLLLEHWMWEYGADSRDDYGRTTLMNAVAAGDLEMTRLMLENGAPINAQTTAGSTALMFAANGGHVELVRFLVENGAEIDIRNSRKYTALSLAEARGHQEVVDFLRSVEDAG